MSANWPLKIASDSVSGVSEKTFNPSPIALSQEIRGFWLARRPFAPSDLGRCQITWFVVFVCPWQKCGLWALYLLCFSQQNIDKPNSSVEMSSMSGIGTIPVSSRLRTHQSLVQFEIPLNFLVKWVQIGHLGLLCKVATVVSTFCLRLSQMQCAWSLNLWSAKTQASEVFCLA